MAGLDSPIKDDEHVVFFPTFGYLTSDQANWVIQIHGWIYEPEEDSRVRRASLDSLRRFLGLERNDEETAIFKQRAQAFLVDNERGKHITIRFDGRRYEAGRSGSNGHFQANLRLSVGAVQPLQAASEVKAVWLRYRAVTRASDERTFAGRVQLIGETGLSVISDIDDTIKISNVSDRKALLRNTFHREFAAVLGMAEVYQKWSAEGAAFHYVSASPWQLFQPLSAFIESAGFPLGTFHLKYFRWKDSSVTALFASPEKLKRSTIEAILAVFPHRKFVLVGDSGEKDPEVYGALARAYPEQVIRILVRDVTGEDLDGPRFQEAFHDVPKECWMVFRAAEELDSRMP